MVSPFANYAPPSTDDVLTAATEHLAIMQIIQGEQKAEAAWERILYEDERQRLIDNATARILADDTLGLVLSRAAILELDINCDGIDGLGRFETPAHEEAFYHNVVRQAMNQAIHERELRGSDYGALSTDLKGYIEDEGIRYVVIELQIVDPNEESEKPEEN